MKIKDNKGFTLIEVIIAMTIFTIIIFIGYRIINGSNLMFKSQLNTTNNQMSINTFNKYISKDIQNSISVEGPIFSKSKSDGSEYTLNNIEKNDEIEYTYTIETKKNGNVSYIVSIKDNRYSISRNDSNNVTLNLIDNEKLAYEGNVLKAPLTIESKSSNDELYYISLEYEGEKSTEDKYNFEVASRYQVSIVNEGNENTGGNTDNGNTGGSNNENIENPSNSDSVIEDGEIIFKFTKKYNNNATIIWNHDVSINLDTYIEGNNSEDYSTKLSTDIGINRWDGGYLQAYTGNSYAENKSSKVSLIKGFTIKFEDGIIIKDLKLIGKDTKVDLTESNKDYTYIISDNIQNPPMGVLLSGKVEIEESANIGETYKINIKLLY